jgi:4-aminobutyrate aminotransferase-like enzyme
MPVLSTGRARDFAELLEQQFAEVEEVADKEAIDYVAPDSVAAMLADDVQAESGNFED